MIKRIRFDALAPGPNLVVLGAVHGNEKAGTKAIERIIDQFEKGILELKKGSVTLVPITNPRAYAENSRFCERNLNRALYVKESPSAYEDLLDPIVCNILDQADVLIDLHSYASKGDAFCFLGNSSETEIQLCRNLGVNDFVYGWAQAFGAVQADSRESMGTVEYARSKGAVATTIECGHHAHPQGAEIGFNAVIFGMAHLGLIDSEAAPTQPQRFVRMHSVYFKTEEGQLAQPWRHYDAVAAGSILAHFESGKSIIAPADGVVVLPKLGAAVGAEWFYFGVNTECPETALLHE